MRFIMPGWDGRVAPATTRTSTPAMENPRPQRSAIRHEPRWHASVAVIAAVLLYATLPPKLTFGPVWIAPLIVLLVLVPLSILAPHRHQETRRMRFWGIFL